LLYLDSLISAGVEVNCEKQQTYWLRLHFVEFVVVNLFMILVASISHWRSCPILFGINLFSLFCLMVLLCSFFHLKFRKRPFSTAADHHEC